MKSYICHLLSFPCRNRAGGELFPLSQIGGNLSPFPYVGGPVCGHQTLHTGTPFWHHVTDSK